MRPVKPHHAAWRAEYEAGATAAQIGERYGVTHQGVSLALRRAGVKMRPRGGGALRMYDDCASAWTAAYEAGASVRSIEAQTGVNGRTIRSYLSAAGVTMRPSGGSGRTRPAWHALAVEARARGETYASIAARFGVGTMTVWSAVNGRRA